MKLFFETSSQASFFLLMLPFGFVVALCLHAGSGGGLLRLIQDLVVLLLSGVAAALMLLSTRDETLRFYHLLGIITGALLYFAGVGRGVAWLRRKIRQAGRNQPADEEIIKHKQGKDEAPRTKQ